MGLLRAYSPQGAGLDIEEDLVAAGAAYAAALQPGSFSAAANKHI